MGWRSTRRLTASDLKDLDGVDSAVTVRCDATHPTAGRTPLEPSKVYTDPTGELPAQTALRGVVSRLIYLDAAEHLGTEPATGTDHHRRCSPATGTIHAPQERGPGIDPRSH